MDAILARLTEHEPETARYSWDNRAYPRAAVLVPLQPHDGELHVLLTVRSKRLSTHPGEVSLPGGKAEGDERPVDTALREAQEEIGLNATTDNVLALLAPIASRMGIVVYPAVVLIDADFVPTPNEEVSSSFTVPLRIFLERQHYTSYTMELRGRPLLIHEFRWEGRRIWALTANILIHVAMIAYGRRPDFEFDYSMYSTLPFPKLSKS